MFRFALFNQESHESFHQLRYSFLILLLFSSIQINLNRFFCESISHKSFFPLKYLLFKHIKESVKRKRKIRSLEIILNLSNYRNSDLSLIYFLKFNPRIQVILPKGKTKRSPRLELEQVRRDK